MGHTKRNRKRFKPRDMDKIADGQRAFVIKRSKEQRTLATQNRAFGGASRRLEAMYGREAAPDHAATRETAHKEGQNDG